MDLNDIRILWTVVSFFVFLAIVAWAYSAGARRGFDEAAQLPLLDDGRPGAGAPVSGEKAR
jgi:cytochrome c oxidase cbb3-type subunit IV